MVKKILERVLNGDRLTVEEGIQLFECRDIILLGKAAQEISRRKHTEGRVTYIVDRNINYTNICLSRCRFCAFYKDEGDPGGYLINYEELAEKIKETKELGGIQILLQGGLHPELTIDYYEKLLKYIKSFDIHIHGFSPPEIHHIASQSNLSVTNTIIRLKEAGLGSIPGGGAEILVDSVRKKASPDKCSASQWLQVMEIAHKQGLRTTATMMFGHVESLIDRLNHLARLRELQDKTSGFTAFIPWPFQKKNTELHSSGGSGIDYLKTLAISRLMLDNFDNLQVSWVTQGGKVAQTALLFGGNDMGSTMIEENVVAAAGASYKISEKEIRLLISEAGFIPQKRNTFYDFI